MRHALLLFCSIALAAHTQPVWVSQGPSPNTNGQVENIANGEVSGAIRSVATHPTNADIVYVGAVNGGIWRTTNARSTSSPLWTEQLGADRSLSIGAIAFDPLDTNHLTLVAGSGRFSSFFRAGGRRVGVWRTADGTDWKPLDGSGKLSGLNVTGVAPRDKIIVLSADDSETAEQPGIWRSTDKGVTWDRVSEAAASNLPDGPSHDLASDPTSPARLYTNAGANGIFRSTDSGETWRKVSDTAMDALLTAALNVKIAVGASGQVYVAIADAELTGLFRSPNGIAPWTALDLPMTRERNGFSGIHPGGQGDNNLSLAADLANANIVYVGGDCQPTADGPNPCNCSEASCVCFPNSLGANDYSGRLFRVDASKPAGQQASAITHVNTRSHSAPHGDSRDMTTDANGDLVEVDDGGIYRRNAPRTNTEDWVSLNGDLVLTEFHSIAWDANANIILGGAQDTGTPQQVSTGGKRWQSLATSDGGDVCVDTTSTPGRSIRYWSYFDFLGFHRQEFDAANTPGHDDFPQLFPVVGSRPLGAFVTPIALNQAEPARLVIGAANTVYESFDRGDTVEAIARRLVVNSRDADPIAYGSTGNPDILYLGSGDDVFIRSVAGTAPTPSTAYLGRGTGRDVVDIVVDRNDPDLAFAADRMTVYRTTNGGSSWNDITGNLLTLTPGNVLAIALSTSNPGRSVIVGSSNGVFVSRGPTFGTWTRLGTGLPGAPVYDLAYDASDEVLVAGLLGRGAWTINLHEVHP